MYHGSNTKISSFVDDFVGGRDAEDLGGPGIYFSSSRENAQHYGEHVYEAVITPRKLLTENPKGGRYNEPIKHYIIYNPSIIHIK